MVSGLELTNVDSSVTYHRLISQTTATSRVVSWFVRPPSHALTSDSASLKAHCPEGIYLFLTPGDPSLWSGVFFIRVGR